MSAASLFGLPPNLDLKGRELVQTYDEVQEYEAKNPYIDFTSLGDMDHIQAHAEAIDLFAKAVPESISKASSFMWYRTPDGAFMLRLPKNNEYLEVFEDATGRWTAKGSVNATHFSRGGFKDAIKAIQFADSLVTIYGMGMISALKQKKTGGAAAGNAQWAVIRNLCKTPEQFDRLPKTLNRVEAAHLIDTLIRRNAGLPPR